MKLHELKPAEGAVKSRKRLGRGTATGQGKPAGRGQKGQKSRSGGGVREVSKIHSEKYTQKLTLNF